MWLTYQMNPLILHLTGAVRIVQQSKKKKLCEVSIRVYPSAEFLKTSKLS